MMSITLTSEDNAVFARLQSTGRISAGLRRVMTQRWNRCCICDQSVEKNRPAFAGYGYDDDPLLVGAECADKLSELATPVYWTGRLDLSVPDDQAVWRYMDFGKFVTMLRQKGLYVPAAETFEDKFEGAIGLASRQSDWDRFYLDFFRTAVTTPPLGVTARILTEAEIEAECARLLKDFKSNWRDLRKTLVSCWHANDGESEALWRLYCPPSTLGVAVRSSVNQLWGLNSVRADTLVGRVRYVNFARSFAANDLERIFCKRSSLQHENEVRLVLSNDRKRPASGMLIPYDLDILLKEVVISPFAPPWFADTVVDIIDKYESKLPVRNSDLVAEPFY